MKNIILFLIVVFIGGLVVGGGINLFSNDTENSEMEVTSETETENSDDVNYVIEASSAELDGTVPDLTRPVIFSEELPQEVRDLVAEKINLVVDRLEQDPTRGDDWLELAVLHHNVSDYEGAKIIWEFLTVIDPKNTVAYDNLGKLYHFSLPDFPKSESYFTQSMAIDPELLAPYLGLHELYRYSYKTETTAAADILRTAIEVFPEEIRLNLTLGNYYREEGNTTLAREVLNEGLNQAYEREDDEMVAAFKRELERVLQ